MENNKASSSTNPNAQANVTKPIALGVAVLILKYYFRDTMFGSWVNRITGTPGSTPQAAPPAASVEGNVERIINIYRNGTHYGKQIHTETGFRAYSTNSSLTLTGSTLLYNATTVGSAISNNGLRYYIIKTNTNTDLFVPFTDVQYTA